jgi:hypothetical protein
MFILQICNLGVLLQKTSILWRVLPRSEPRRGVMTTKYFRSWITLFSMTTVWREKQLGLLKTSHQSPAGSAASFSARGDHDRTLIGLQHVWNLPQDARCFILWQPDCTVIYLETTLCHFHQLYLLTAYYHKISVLLSLKANTFSKLLLLQFTTNLTSFLT